MRYRRLIRLVKLLVLLLSVTGVAACQTMGSSGGTIPPTVNTAAFCDVARPIWWSVKDTKKTIVQVKEHNAVGKMCGWTGK